VVTTKRFLIVVLEKHWIQSINTLLVWEEWHGQLPASQRVWRHDFERFFIWVGYEQVPNNLASKEVEKTGLYSKCLHCWDIVACFNSSVLHLLLEISVMRTHCQFEDIPVYYKQPSEMDRSRSEFWPIKNWLVIKSEKPISSKFVMPQFTPLHWNLSPCFTDWYTPLMNLKKGHKPCTSSVKIIIIRHTTQGECTQMNDGQHSGSRGNGQNKKSRTFQAFKKSLKGI